MKGLKKNRNIDYQTKGIVNLLILLYLIDGLIDTVLKNNYYLADKIK